MLRRLKAVTQRAAKNTKNRKGMLTLCGPLLVLCGPLRYNEYTYL